MKKRTGEPFMPADQFGRGLMPGIGINLLVPDVAAETGFCRSVLGASVHYEDPDFAVLEIAGSTMLVHADHAYDDHEFRSVFEGEGVRGRGIELRLYGFDPDLAEARARDAGAIVLSGSIDKPHGLRECYIVDPQGYVWVPSRRI